MKQLNIQISDAGTAGGDRQINVPYEGADLVNQVAQRISESTGVDGLAIIEVALGVDTVDENKPVGELPQKHIGIHRVCVEVHFETESEKHWFPIQAKWASVHRWGCKEFNVARDACANLELREGSATGAAINERQAIGAASDCKVVWLVKPGPEQNG